MILTDIYFSRFVKWFYGKEPEAANCITPQFYVIFYSFLKTCNNIIYPLICFLYKYLIILRLYDNFIMFTVIAKNSGGFLEGAMWRFTPTP